MQEEPILSVESFSIKDYVLGSFHQGDKRFGETAGTQCACMALTALCWSVIWKVSIWGTSDLDYILKNGDRVYKKLGRFGLLSADDIPSEISVIDVNVCFNIHYLSLENGAVDINVEDFPYWQVIHLSTSEKGNGFSMFVCGFTVTVTLYNAVTLWLP